MAPQAASGSGLNESSVQYDAVEESRAGFLFPVPYSVLFFHSSLPGAS